MSSVRRNNGRKKRQNKQWQKGLLVTVSAVVMVYGWQIFHDHVKTNLSLHPVISYSAPATQTLPNSLPLTEADVDSLVAIPELRTLAETVRTRLPVYTDYWHQLPNLAHGKSVDVILQIHEVRRADPGYDRVVQAVQSRIAKMLDRLKPEMVATEGQSMDDVNETSMMVAVDTYAKQHGINYDPVAMRAQVKASMQFDGSLIHRKHHPSTRIIGEEDDPLNGLHDTEIEWAERNSLSGSEPHLMVVLRQERSAVALYRLLSLMEREHCTYGVLIIGYAHAPELEALCRGLGLRGNFYKPAR